MQFDVSFSKRTYKVCTNLLGKHNVYNILSAIAVCLHIGISIDKAIKSISSFFGASRRFDVYENISINKYKPIIIDDYGHFEGARKAVDEYFSQLSDKYFMHRIDYSARIIIKN